MARHKAAGFFAEPIPINIRSRPRHAAPFAFPAAAPKMHVLQRMGFLAAVPQRHSGPCHFGYPSAYKKISDTRHLVCRLPVERRQVAPDRLGGGDAFERHQSQMGRIHAGGHGQGDRKTPHPGGLRVGFSRSGIAVRRNSGSHEQAANFRAKSRSHQRPSRSRYFTRRCRRHTRFSGRYPAALHDDGASASRHPDTFSLQGSESMSNHSSFPRASLSTRTWTKPG